MFFNIIKSISHILNIFLMSKYKDFDNTFYMQNNNNDEIGLIRNRMSPQVNENI